MTSPVVLFISGLAYPSVKLTPKSIVLSLTSAEIPLKEVSTLTGDGPSKLILLAPENAICFPFTLIVS